MIQIPDLFKNSGEVYQYRLLLSNLKIPRQAFIHIYESKRIEEHLTSKDIDFRNIMIRDKDDIKDKVETKVSGVYMLYTRMGVLKYIGKSKNVRRRLAAHYNTKYFDVAHIFTMSERDMHWVEPYLITRLFPKENQEMADKYPVAACCHWTPVNTLRLQ